MKQEVEAEKVKLTELEPGAIIKLSPEQLTKMRNTSRIPEGVETAVFLGGVSSWREARALNLEWFDKKKNTFGPVNTVNLPIVSRVEVLKEKTEASIKSQFMKKYKTGFPTPSHVGMTIGGDPEIFALKGDGSVLPAWEFLPDKGRGRTYYWDGVQAEWQANPRNCLVEYNNGLQANIQNIAAQARKADKKARLSMLNVVDIPQRILENAEQKYLDFGCSPSINVYDDIGEPPQDPRQLPVRFAGGHIHAGMIGLGYTPQVRHMVYALDGMLGVPCVAMAERFDNPTRRRFYGRAGEIRLPKHGLEYRVLSNFWLVSPPITYLVHEMFRAAVKFGMSGIYSMFFKTPQDEVRRIINECDVKEARACVKANKKLLEHSVKWMNFGEYTRTAKWMFKAIENGVQGVLPSLDIETNWDRGEIRKIFSAGHSDMDYNEGRAGDLTWNRMSVQLENKRVLPVGD